MSYFKKKRLSQAGVSPDLMFGASLPSLKLTFLAPEKWVFPIGISCLPGAPIFRGEVLVSGRVGTTQICQVGKRTTSRLSLPESQREDLDLTSCLQDSL